MHLWRRSKYDQEHSCQVFIACLSRGNFDNRNVAWWPEVKLWIEIQLSMKSQFQLFIYIKRSLKWIGVLCDACSFFLFFFPLIIPFLSFWIWCMKLTGGEVWKCAEYYSGWRWRRETGLCFLGSWNLPDWTRLFERNRNFSKNVMSCIFILLNNNNRKWSGI